MRSEFLKELVASLNSPTSIDILWVHIVLPSRDKVVNYVFELLLIVKSHISVSHTLTCFALSFLLRPMKKWKSKESIVVRVSAKSY